MLKANSCWLCRPENVLGILDGKIGKRVPKVVKRIENADEADIEALLGEEDARKGRKGRRPSSALGNGEPLERPPPYEHVSLHITLLRHQYYLLRLCVPPLQSVAPVFMGCRYWSYATWWLLDKSQDYRLKHIARSSQSCLCAGTPQHMGVTASSKTHAQG